MSDNKDWTGNGNSIFKTLGASNHTEKERETDDFYATSPKAIDILFDYPHITLPYGIWEPSCGSGCLSKRMEQRGHYVVSTDLIDRGYGRGGGKFLRAEADAGRMYGYCHQPSLQVRNRICAPFPSLTTRRRHALFVPEDNLCRRERTLLQDIWPSASSICVAMHGAHPMCQERKLRLHGGARRICSQLCLVGMA